MTVLDYDPIASLSGNGEGLLEAARLAGLEADVVSCPGWSVRDLVRHVGGVWHFWTTVVRTGIVTFEEARAVAESDQVADGETIDWARGCLDESVEVLSQADPKQEIWTWTGGNRPAAWVLRRMAQETAVHRWDAEDTLGTDWTIDPVVASDGIEEFFNWHAGRPVQGTPEVGGSVHLHCTDTEGEWTVTNMAGDNVDYERAHTKGDAAVKGEANALLLWLWRRNGASVEIFGDTDIAQRLQNYSNLD